MMHLLEAPPVVDPIQFTIGSPDNSLFTGTTPQFAVSPDAATSYSPRRHRAPPCCGFGRSGHWWRIRCRAPSVATYPFSSADSRFIGFFAQGEAEENTGQWRSAGPVMRCAEWARRHMNSDNVILFSPSSASPLHRVTSAGGTHPHHRDRDECPFPSLAGIPA